MPGPRAPLVFRGRSEAAMTSGQQGLSSNDERTPSAFALTPGQKSLWLMQRMLPDSAVYHIALAVRILPPLERSALQGAIQAIADRHDALRTVFRIDAGGELMQQVGARVPAA